jgi:hypothetical protein
MVIAALLLFSCFFVPTSAVLSPRYGTIRINELERVSDAVELDNDFFLGDQWLLQKIS